MFVRRSGCWFTGDTVEFDVEVGWRGKRAAGRDECGFRLRQRRCSSSLFSLVGNAHVRTSKPNECGCELPLKESSGGKEFLIHS